MTSMPSGAFRTAAIAEGGQPVAAGGPPLRSIGIAPCSVVLSDAERRFLAAARVENGQAVSAGGPPMRSLPESAPARRQSHQGATSVPLFAGASGQSKYHLAISRSALAALELTEGLYGSRFSKEVELWIDSLAAAAVERRELKGESGADIPAILQGVTSRPIQSTAVPVSGPVKPRSLAKAVLSLLLGRRYPPIEIWAATRMFTPFQGLAFNLTALFEVDHIERRVIVFGFPELSSG